MVNFDTDLYTALESYFKTLEKTGYVPYKEVACLIVYSYLLELLNEDTLEIISLDDFNTIIAAIYILIEQSYLLKYPDFMKDRITYNTES